MKRTKIIDFELMKYEKELKDMINTIGIKSFEETNFEISLTSKERELLIKCSKTTIDLLEGLLEENEHFEGAFYNQIEFVELLEDSKCYNTNLELSPSQHEWPLISLEIGGKINQDSVLNKNEVDMFWNNKDYKILVNLFKKFLDKYKVIVKLINPYDIPEHLRD